MIERAGSCGQHPLLTNRPFCVEWRGVNKPPAFDEANLKPKYVPQEPQNVGRRVRALRLRRELTLVELAALSNLDVSYLSRLERDAIQNAKPKPDTINRVLDALQATQQERDAVYHIERPALTRREITLQVLEIASLDEDPEPLLLRDEHWYVWYYNRAARAALGLSEAEYEPSIGAHMLYEIIDPSIPRYSRVPEDTREEAFSLRARMFQLDFAGQEFDQWYQDVVSRVYEFPWAVPLWERPLTTNSLVIGRQDMLLLNPIAGRLHVRLQLNRLMSNPRFLLTNWTPLDDETANHIAKLRERPEFAYDVLRFYPTQEVQD
jgi:transcriptional regulator with XRE-family HTH domain